MRSRTATVCLCISLHSVTAQTSIPLPDPTGPFAIGRVTVLCLDESRLEPFDRTSRRIVADVWYPAEPVPGSQSNRAPYLAVEAMERIMGAEQLRQQLGPAYQNIKAGIITHTVANAPFARSIHLSPLLIFSPGGGMIRELYTAQLEDLASHGYIVAAVTHSYDGFLTLFPDGSSLSYDGKRWPKPPSVEGEASLNQLEWHADDIRFVLDKLTRRPGDVPFAGKIDRHRIGAFGHSFGGISSVRACQKDPRIKACMNQDGAVAMQPFFLDPRGWGMDQPFMLIERAVRTEPPSDADLAEMQLTRQQVQTMRNRLDARKDAALRATGKGTYHIVLPRDGTSHMDFSDLPILGATQSADLHTHQSTMSVIRTYTRLFFDQSLSSQRRRPPPSPTASLPRIRRRQVITRVVHPVTQHPLQLRP